MSSQRGNDEVPDGNGYEDVISWEQEVEDRTLVTLQRDLEKDPESGFDRNDLEGTKGKLKGEPGEFVTEFEEEFEIGGHEVYISVERQGGLNSLEYWSESPDLMEVFDEYVEERKVETEQDPILEPYKFDDVPSNEVAELVSLYYEEFETTGPLARGSNGEPRMHMQRVTDIEDSNEYRRDEEQQPSLNKHHTFPGDAEIAVEGIEDEIGDEEVSGVLRISPQKRERGLYTVSLDGDSPESQAYLVNTALRVLEPQDRESPDL
jgi:hypothetical protein